MANTRRQPNSYKAWSRCILYGLGVALSVATCSAPVLAQTVLFQEGFNDAAAAGTNFLVEGQGQEPDGVDGPGSWDFNFQVDQIGLANQAAARRAAILWGHDVEPDFWTDEAVQVWDGLVDWALDGRASTNIYFLPDVGAITSEFLADRLEGQGHSTFELFAGDPIPRDADLVVNTGASAADPPAFLADKDVPVITFNAGNHDDTAISSIGAASTFFDPVEVTVVEENKDHPILGGLSGTLPWTTEAPFAALDGIGVKVAPDAQVLATYIDPDTGEELPAVVILEQEGDLLGAFNPTPEGTGYWVGGAVDEDFGGFAGAADMPRVLEFGPIDVAGREDVELSMGLAGSDVDFEDTDFLRISIDPDNSGEYQVLAEFVGNAGKALDDGTTELNPREFSDVTFDIPSDATELSIRIEAFNTFPNEIVAIDNLRVTAAGGVALQPGDSDENLEFNQLDLVKVQIAAKYLTGQAATWGDGDWNGAPGGSPGNPPQGDGQFNQLDIIAALGAGKYLTGPYGAIKTGGVAGDGQTSITYDPSTGELAVDAPAGAELTSINVDSAGSIFTGDAAQNLGGSFDNDADGNIFKATFGSSFGSLSFGMVAQAGLSEAFVADDLTVVGSLAGGGALGEVDLIYVPEPASLLLLTLGLLLCPRLRQRAARP